MGSPRIPRPYAEMVERLGEHTALLRDHLERVQREDRHYLGEVAAKVRLLAIDGRSNKALLRRVGELVGATPSVVIQGPPGWVFMDGHRTGDQLTLWDWLDTF